MGILRKRFFKNREKIAQNRDLRHVYKWAPGGSSEPREFFHPKTGLWCPYGPNRETHAGPAKVRDSFFPKNANKMAQNHDLRHIYK